MEPANEADKNSSAVGFGDMISFSHTNKMCDLNDRPYLYCRANWLNNATAARCYAIQSVSLFMNYDKSSRRDNLRGETSVQ